MNSPDNETPREEVMSTIYITPLSSEAKNAQNSKAAFLRKWS